MVSSVGAEDRAGGVELREGLGQLVGVLGDEVGGLLVVGLGQRALERVQQQGQVALGRLADDDRARHDLLLGRLAQDAILMRTAWYSRYGPVLPSKLVKRSRSKM